MIVEDYNELAVLWSNTGYVPFGGLNDTVIHKKYGNPSQRIGMSLLLDSTSESLWIALMDLNSFFLPLQVEYYIKTYVNIRYFYLQVAPLAGILFSPGHST